MSGMLSVPAELQRELIVANTHDGLAAARARVGGRRPRLTLDQAALAQQLSDARGQTVQQIADLFRVPRSTVYEHLVRATTVSRRPKGPRQWWPQENGLGPDATCGDAICLVNLRARAIDAYTASITAATCGNALLAEPYRQ